MMYKILNDLARDLVQVNHSDLVYNSSVTCGHSSTYQLEWMYIPTPSSPPLSEFGTNS